MKKKKVRYFFVVIIVIFAGVIFYYHYEMNTREMKFMLGEIHYSHEEVKTFYTQHKKELDEMAEVIRNKCSFYHDNSLKLGIAIFTENKLFNKNKYKIMQSKYKDGDLIHGNINTYQQDYFEKKEIELLNILTKDYCELIEVKPQYYSKEKKKGTNICFVLKGSTIYQVQELVYAIDGTYSDDTGTIQHLDGNWYYHYLLD